MDRKSGGRPPRTAQRERSEHLLAFPGWRNRRRPLWCELYASPVEKGVAVIRARGWEFRFPEDITLLEALLVVNGQVPPRNG